MHIINGVGPSWTTLGGLLSDEGPKRTEQALREVSTQQLQRCCTAVHRRNVPLCFEVVQPRQHTRTEIEQHSGEYNLVEVHISLF